jgi:hypothetical protein
MEPPRRERGDELLKDGELTALRNRLRKIAPEHDLATVIACAFDHRTRMLPFIYADMRMAPAGVRAVGAAMFDAGFQKTRIVLQQWNRRFRPSQMRLDGRIPDIFMVSSMQIHTTECKNLIRDACRIDPEFRPLIIAGGAKTIYEPWDVFSVDPEDPWAADVAVTGEEYVLLSLLEALLEIRAGKESLRTTFIRARNSGMLDSIPGLVYARTDRKDGIPEELESLVGLGTALGVLVHIAAMDERFGQKRGVVEVEPEAFGELASARRHRPRWGLLVEVLVDVVDSVLDGADPLRVLVGDLGSELLLEAHDELDEVKGVGIQVIHERRLRLDFGLVHTELLDDDLLESLVGRSGHSAGPSVWASVTVSVELPGPAEDSSSRSVPSL